MININPQFITDAKGNKISVVLPVKEFEALLKELEDMEDIRLFDEAKESDEPSFPIDEGFRMVEEERNINKEVAYRVSMRNGVIKALSKN